jgi:hypothetical protein
VGRIETYEVASSAVSTMFGERPRALNAALILDRPVNEKS